MDNRKQAAAKKRAAQQKAERQKYQRIQRNIRAVAVLAAIVLAIVSLYQSCSTQKAIDELKEQLHAKKLAEAQAELQALQEAQASPSPVVSMAPSTSIGGKSITLSFVGDCTLTNPEGAASAGSFEEYYKENGAPYFFQNVKSIFEGDDLTIANLEGTFTGSDNRADKEETFKADPSHVTILASAGVDAVNLANDHTHDYGNESYVDTLANLNIANIGHFGNESTLIVDVGGIPVGLTGIYECETGIACKSSALSNVKLLKDQGAKIIVVQFHWGEEYETAPTDVHTELAHAVIDAGADLVVGHHAHTLQAVELYKGKYIAYGLGDFCNGRDPNPEDYDTMILQQTFTVVNGNCQGNADLDIIPCSISTETGKNTYCPTPAEGAEAERIIEKIYALSAEVEGGISQAGSGDTADDGTEDLES